MHTKLYLHINYTNCWSLIKSTLIQEDIRLQWQMYIPWNFYSMLYQYWVWGIQWGRFPFPFFPVLIIPLLPFPVLVLAWLYRNKAKLDEAWEITCQPYKARNMSPGGALTKICLFISVNYAWFTLLVWQNLNIQIIYKLKHVYCFNNIWGLKLL